MDLRFANPWDVSNPAYDPGYARVMTRIYRGNHYLQPHSLRTRRGRMLQRMYRQYEATDFHRRFGWPTYEQEHPQENEEDDVS